MLLDPAHARELLRDDRGPEVIAAAGEVHDLGARPREGRLDALVSARPWWACAGQASDPPTSLHFVKLWTLTWRADRDQLHREGRREGQGVPRRPERRRADLRPAGGRPRRRLLRLPVRAGVRHAARRRRGVRGPRAPHPRRPPEPARTSAARSSTTSTRCRAPASRSRTPTWSPRAAAAPRSAWPRRKRSPPSSRPPRRVHPGGMTVSRALAVAAAVLGLALAACGGSGKHAAEEDAGRLGRGQAGREAAEGPRGRHHRAQPELRLAARRQAGAAGVRALAEGARRDPAGLLPHPARLAVARAAAGHGRTSRSRRPAACAASRRARRSAGLREQLRGARRAAEARRLAGADGGRRHARLGRPARPPAASGRRPCRARARRAPTQLAAYERFIGEVLKLADDVGADLRYWSPWNEPNHPYSLSPQRRAVQRRLPGRGARALRGAGGRDAPGARARRRATRRWCSASSPACPRAGRSRAASASSSGRCRRTSCAAATVWTQHGYIGGVNPVDDVEKALATFSCPQKHAIWMTETGRRRGRARPQALGVGAQAARHLRGAAPPARPLVRGRARDGGVPVHASARTTCSPSASSRPTSKDAYPSLDEWKAWGQAKRPRPDDPPPPESCGQPAAPGAQ